MRRERGSLRARAGSELVDEVDVVLCIDIRSYDPPRTSKVNTRLSYRVENRGVKVLLTSSFQNVLTAVPNSHKMSSEVVSPISRETGRPTIEVSSVEWKLSLTSFGFLLSESSYKGSK